MIRGQSLNNDICWDLNFTKNTNFQSLEAVDRSSETQLRVDKNLNFLAHISVLRVIMVLCDLTLA